MFVARGVNRIMASHETRNSRVKVKLGGFICNLTAYRNDKSPANELKIESTFGVILNISSVRSTERRRSRSVIGIERVCVDAPLKDVC